MSLKSFVATKEVRDRFAPLRAAVVRPRPSPIRVPPKSGRHPLVGTALDYLLRFELKRRAPESIEREWVAATACSHLELCLGSAASPDEVRRVCRALEAATDAVARHRTRARVSEAEVADLASHALRLAGIDVVVRAGLLDPDFDRPDPDSVADLVALWAAVPWPDLARGSPILLNPVFEHGSRRVGGADADLIAGSALIDFKVVQRNVQAEDLNQLIGYLLLAREERRCDPAFPPVTHVGVYLARHGVCWTAPAEPVLNAPEFRAVEEWFWAHAATVYRPRGPVPLPPDWPADLTPPLGTTDPEAWRRFATAVAGRPDLAGRWGWPGPETIAAIPDALVRWAADGKAPSFELCPSTCGHQRDPLDGRLTLWVSTGRPLPRGTAVAPGQFQRLAWRALPGRSARPRGRSANPGAPGDFPGLVEHYPQAAWDFFLGLAKPPASGHPEPVRAGEVVKPAQQGFDARATRRRPRPKGA